MASYLDVIGADLTYSRFSHEVGYKDSDLGMPLSQNRIFVHDDKNFFYPIVLPKKLVARLTKVPPGSKLYIRLIWGSHDGNFFPHGKDPWRVFEGVTRYPTIWISTNIEDSVEVPHLLIRVRRQMYHPLEVECRFGDTIEESMTPANVPLPVNEEPIYRIDETGKFRKPSKPVIWWAKLKNSMRFRF